MTEQNINSKDLAEFYYERGIKNSRDGNKEQAISDLRKSIEIDPSSIQAYCQIGLIYANMDNLTEAIQNFDKAIELEPNNAEIYSSKAETYLSHSNPVETIKNCDKALMLDSWHWKSYFLRGRACFMLSNDEQFRSDFTLGFLLITKLGYNQNDIIGYYLNGLPSSLAEQVCATLQMALNSANAMGYTLEDFININMKENKAISQNKAYMEHSNSRKLDL